MPASLAASACGLMDEGREGEAESRVVWAGFCADLGRSREGEAARRAARECTVTSVGIVREIIGEILRETYGAS